MRIARYLLSLPSSRLLGRALDPMNARPPLVQRAVSQEQIDEILIRHTQSRAHFLEVLLTEVLKRDIEINGALK